MGSAHGFASTDILRAESPVDADGFWQLNAVLGGLSVLNRSVGCVSLGVPQCWYIGGPLALQRNGALAANQTGLGGSPVLSLLGTARA